MAIFSSRLADEPQEWLPTGFTPFHVTVNVPTEALDSADEQVLLYQFPTSASDNEVWLQRLIFDVGALDGGVTLVYDVGIGGSDGVIVTPLATGSTAGQGGGTDIIVDNVDLPVDVEGQYLIVDVTAAAGTPQAGAIEAFGKFAAGVLSKTADAEEVT